MSVPVPLRRETILTTQVMADKLVKYTLDITSNPKHFDPRYQKVIDDIVEASMEISHNIWRANNVRVTGKSSLKRRDKYQRKAYEECNRLLYLINLSITLFDNRGKRIEYWTKRTRDVKDKIRNWRKSDRERYSV